MFRLTRSEQRIVVVLVLLLVLIAMLTKLQRRNTDSTRPLTSAATTPAPQDD